MLYPEETGHYWRVIGGSAVGVRQLGDYLNMVFRNGEIPATANLIPVQWNPKLAAEAKVQAGHLAVTSLWHWEYRSSVEVDRLRRAWKPDLMYFVSAQEGGAGALRGSLDPYVNFGFSSPDPYTFAHEVGHNLGGHHEPVTFGDGFEEYQSASFRPYRFGHTDMTSCAKREGWPDSRLICPSTIMSYGFDATLDDDPRTWHSYEPFYSSVRHKPNGWTIGKAGTSEVERLFHETVPVQARSGQEPWRAEQHPRRVTGARWTGRDTLRVDWSEDWRSRDGGLIRLTLAEGTNDTYEWSWDNQSDPNVAPILKANGSQVGVEVSGVRPGGSYRLAVQGPDRRVAVGEPTIQALPSDVFLLKPPERASGSPAAPNNVGAAVTGPNSVRLHWRDNSRVEDGHEVWYRKVGWSCSGCPKRQEPVWRLYGEPLPAGARLVEVDGLVADRERTLTGEHYTGDGGIEILIPGNITKVGFYSFVVVAYNDRGWNASETFHLEFMPEPPPERTVSGKVTDCARRFTGIDVDGFQIDACLETPDGARRRAWDYRLEADQSGLLYFFDRDNAEILVKVLDGCAINGYRWVFVAPVTTLTFRLQIREPGPYIANRRQIWHYDSERRSQGRVRYERVGNPGEVGDARDWGLDSTQSGLMYFFERNNAEVLIKVLDGCGVNGHRWVFVAPVTDLAFNLVVESPGGERWTHSNRLGRTADAASDVSAFPCASLA